MKRDFLRPLYFILSIILSFTSAQLFAQVIPTPIKCEPPRLVNFSELADREALRPMKLKPIAVEQGEDKFEFKIKPKAVPKNATVTQLNEEESKIESLVSASPAPTKNFTGIVDNATIIPPDINGTVGKTYIMETTNQEFKIYNKGGILIKTLSLAAFLTGMRIVNFLIHILCTILVKTVLLFAAMKDILTSL